MPFKDSTNGIVAEHSHRAGVKPGPKPRIVSGQFNSFND